MLGIARGGIGHVSNSIDDDNEFANLAVNLLRPMEISWALDHDYVHGLGYAFNNPVAIADATDDPDDDRKTYLVRVRRTDLADAMDRINDWIIRNPGPAGMHAFGFVRALSREGLAAERKAGGQEPHQ